MVTKTKRSTTKKSTVKKSSPRKTTTKKSLLTPKFKKGLAIYAAVQTGITAAGSLYLYKKYNAELRKHQISDDFYKPFPTFFEWSNNFIKTKAHNKISPLFEKKAGEPLLKSLSW